MARASAAAVGVMFGAISIAALPSSVWADAPLTDVARAPNAQDNSKFAGSYAEGSTYVAPSSFYTSGYRDPYVSLAFYVKPVYDLGTRYKLALTGRLYLEEELTQPDNPAGRHFYPYDLWVQLTAQNLHTFDSSKIRIGGYVRTVWPLSYESRYSHLVAGVGGGTSVNRDFVFGWVNDDARKWTLKLSYVLAGYKWLQTSEFRGSGPGDTTGCLAPPSAGAPGASFAGSGGPSVSAADRCGGPANTNYTIADIFIVSLTRGKWSAMVNLLIQNDFKYAFPSDAVAPGNAVPEGRVDSTWGIIALGYQLRPLMGLAVGVSSMQPALDSRYRYPRFPFFDFSGTNANNYTQFFLSVNGSL